MMIKIDRLDNWRSCYILPPRRDAVAVTLDDEFVVGSRVGLH